MKAERRPSGIGGQAVLEGVMMKNKEKYAIAVRKPDREIVVEYGEYKGIGASVGLNRIPILRGMLAFVDSMILGIRTLTVSGNYYEPTEEKTESEKNAEPVSEDTAEAVTDTTTEASTEHDTADTTQQKTKSGGAGETILSIGMVLISICFAVGLFILLPYFISSIITKHLESQLLLTVIEGVLRIALFLGYVIAISRMKDIRRLFMYHGAEHKTINCIECGLAPSVSNVREHSRFHKRCGTSFMLIVMFFSILFFMFIRTESPWLRLGLRLLLIPVIAGVSYEFIKLAGRNESWVMNLLSQPGLWMQRLTTKEPDDEMIVVAVASVEAVFDWQAFLEEGAREAAARKKAEKQAKKMTEVLPEQPIEDQAEQQPEKQSEVKPVKQEKKRNAKQPERLPEEQPEILSEKQSVEQPEEQIEEQPEKQPERRATSKKKEDSIKPKKEPQDSPTPPLTCHEEVKAEMAATTEPQSTKKTKKAQASTGSHIGSGDLASLDKVFVFTPKKSTKAATVKQTRPEAPRRGVKPVNGIAEVPAPQEEEEDDILRALDRYLDFNSGKKNQ